MTSSRYFTYIWNLMEMKFCCPSIHGKEIATSFCTCHNSTADYSVDPVSYKQGDMFDQNVISDKYYVNYKIVVHTYQNQWNMLKIKKFRNPLKKVVMLDVSDGRNVNTHI